MKNYMHLPLTTEVCLETYTSQTLALQLWSNERKHTDFNALKKKRHNLMRERQKKIEEIKSEIERLLSKS